MITPTQASILAVGGTDPVGLAGLHTDIHTARAMGVHCHAVVTANTAQNNRAFIALHPTSSASFSGQLSALHESPIKVVKTGLLASAEQVDCIRQFVSDKRLPLVIDPVLAATSGGGIAESVMEAIKHTLIPLARVLSPNIPEAEKLLGRVISTPTEIESAAEEFLAMGAQSVFIKGGHREGKLMQDYFCSQDRRFWLSAERVETKNTRGTGCAQATAIACAIALDYSVHDAVVIGKMAIQQGLRAAYSLEGEKGCVAVSHFPNEQIDLPVLSQSFLPEAESYGFPDCGETPLGLYPIVERAQWLARLVPLGVTTAQLRVKDLHGDALEAEIKQAISVARRYNCRLFINDFWELAIKHGAYGVHLGQEDLDTADIRRIQAAGLRLGTSTHCHYEVARAHRYRPSYMAFGPVWATTTKAMPWIPQGEKGFAYWSSLLNYPLVGIGGVNKARALLLKQHGADGIAMITAITEAQNPEATTEEFLQQLQSEAQ